jgi:hypothetical protein
MEVDPAESSLCEGHGHGGGAFESPEEEFDFDAAPVTPAAAVGTVPPGLEEVNQLQQQHQEQEQEQSTGYSIESILHTYGGCYMGHWAADDPHGDGSVVLRNGQVSGNRCGCVGFLFFKSHAVLCSLYKFEFGYLGVGKN